MKIPSVLFGVLLGLFSIQAHAGKVKTAKDGSKYCEMKNGTIILPPFISINGNCKAATIKKPPVDNK